MKLEQLTKPQIILLWMTTCSKYADALCEGDKDVLIRNKAFKDRKSISNALYQLHNAGYIKKFKDSWFILDAGKQHLQDAIAKLENKSKVPKAEEWTDADFGITPQVREYINKFEAENARLNELLEHYKQMHNSNLATYDELVEKNAELEKKLKNANDVIVKLQNELQQVIMSNRYIRDSNDSLRHRITELKKKLESNNTIDDNLKIAFQNCAKAFNILANI